MKHWVRALALAVAATGCGGAKMVAVEGVATLDGKPLANAAVLFTPEDGTGQPGVGVTDAEGRFAVTANAATGVAPGRYKVTVQVSEPAKTEPAKGEPVKAGAEIDSPEYVKMMAAAGKKAAEPAAPSPLARYATPSTTPLVVDVPAEGVKNVELKLESK